MAKILIVDDNTDEAETLARLLRAGSHRVATATNGRDALASIINDMPDVVLLDLIMPEMDGPSFLEVVRSYLRLQALPVVVLTAAPDSPMVDRTRALKVNTILAKAKASTEEILKALAQAVGTVPG